jgi:hypothetical protein
MTRLPGRDGRGGDPLGLGFGGGEHICNPLWFVSMVAGVGDGGAIGETFRSIIVLHSSGLDALVWLIPEPPASGTRITPSVRQ